MGIRKKALKKDDSPLLLEVDDIIKKAKLEGNIENQVTNIEAIIKTNPDIRIKRVDMPSEESGSLKKCNDGTWELSVNNLHHINRQRFTLAHEYGHYCLHKDKQSVFTDEIFFRNANNDSMEYAANEFAAKILMPESDFRSLILTGTTSIRELALIFKVSASAIKIRAKQLGY